MAEPSKPSGFNNALLDMPLPRGERRKIVYRRQELYEQVWTEPVSAVAARYGISNVALAKMCKRLHVPVPGRGYWTKKSSGKTAPRAPLSKLPPGSLEEISTNRWVPYTKEFLAAREAERQQRELVAQEAELAAQEAEQEEADRQQRIDDLRTEIDVWRLARDIRAYVAEGQRIVIDGGCDVSKGGPLEEYFEWALDYADEIDPFSDLRKDVAAMAASRDTTNAKKAQ